MYIKFWGYTTEVDQIFIVHRKWHKESKSFEIFNYLSFTVLSFLNNNLFTQNRIEIRTVHIQVSKRGVKKSMRLTIEIKCNVHKLTHLNYTQNPSWELQHSEIFTVCVACLFVEVLQFA